MKAIAETPLVRFLLQRIDAVEGIVSKPFYVLENSLPWQRLKPFLFWGLVVLLILLAGFRAPGADRDWDAYYGYISETITAGNFNNLRFEPAFNAIVMLSGMMSVENAPRIVFLIMALLAVTLKAGAIWRYSRIPLFGLLVYVGLFYLPMEMNMIRAGVAVGFFLWALEDIAKRRPLWYYLKILVAITMHYSSVVALPLYLLTFEPERWQKIVYLLLPLAGILFFYVPFFHDLLMTLLLHGPDFLAQKIQSYMGLRTMKGYPPINIWAPFFFSRFILYYFMYTVVYWAGDGIDELDRVMVRIYGWGLFLFYFFAQSSILSARVAEYLTIVILLLLARTVAAVPRIKWTAVLVGSLYLLMVLWHQIFIEKWIFLEKWFM